MICTPAIIYLVFGIVEIIFDLHTGLNNTAFVKIVIVIFFTTLLNLICSVGLEPLSWFLVILPFVFTGFVVASILYQLSLDASNGNIYNNNKFNQNCKPKKLNPPRQYLSFSPYYDTYIA